MRLKIFLNNIQTPIKNPILFLFKNIYIENRFI